MTTSRIGPSGVRILLAGLTAFLFAAVLLQFPAHGKSATGDPQPSAKVAVVPGFTPPPYGGSGLPAFPAGNSQLSAYHFTELAADKLTTVGLAPYDTVILYGIRWSDISPSGQAAINAFATTHKVVIWDSDSTGSQTYGTFIHPFSETASGASGRPNDSVVTFPGGVDFLASNKPSSPYYLDPSQLISSPSMINDMNAMKTGTANWVPALIAQNKNIPQGGWVLAWSYGVIRNHTGLTIYSGIDADAFGNTQIHPNYAIKELALQLAAPFRGTPDPACASHCTLPAAGGTTSVASCKFAKPVPKHWVRGRVHIAVKTAPVSGITGQVVTGTGRVVASGRGGSDGIISLRVRTRSLPSNRTSRLRAVVLVRGQSACTNSFRLKVDNTPPRLLLLRTGGHLVTLRASERSWMSIVGSHVRHRRPVLIAGRRTIRMQLPASVTRARLILRDRAGNTLVRRLVW